MIIRFMKGIDRSRPELWSSSNLFALSGKRDSRRPKLKKLIKLLRYNGVKSKIESFVPNNWNLLVDAVVIDSDPANEAFFIILANNGIEI